MTELSLEQIGICLMYILHQVKWRGGGRKVEMIEREREREGDGRRIRRRRRKKKRMGERKSDLC